jgi:capsular exopolysaccharide synthesis family protein
VSTSTYTRQINTLENEGPDVREFLRLLRRRGWIILVCLLIIPTAVYVYTSGRPKVFEASTVIAPQRSGTSAIPSQFQAPETNVQAVAGLVNTAAVANEAARRLGLQPGALAGAASATADPDTNFITITASGPTQKAAIDRANAFAAALNTTQNRADQQRITDAVSSIQQQLSKTPKSDPNRAQLQSQLQSLQTLQRARSQNVQVLQPATGATQVAPHPRRNAVLAVLLALLIGIGLVLFSERIDRRLRKPEDLERLTDAPFLGTIPDSAFAGVEESRDVAEAFQTLRNSLAFLDVDNPFRSLAVTSGLKAEGKTTVALHLAMAYAKFGKRVILVDTDLRKPDLAQRVGLNNSPGLSQVLTGDASLEQAFQDVSPYGAGLRLLPAGQIPPNPSALLGSLRMASLLDELAADADILILDTTPLLIVSDAFPLLDKVAGVVAVTRLDQTPRDAIRKMLQIAGSAGAQVAGLVVTDARSGLTGYGYGYGYGSEYGADGTQTGSDDVALEPNR